MTKIKETINTIKEILTKQQYDKSEYHIETSQTENILWIHIYKTYMEYHILKEIEKNNINIVTIWPDEHEFEINGEKININCTKTSIAVYKNK